jgi:hypothetical protein
MGDAPPLLPWSKPFDLSPWKLVGTIGVLALVFQLPDFLGLSDESFQADMLVSPMMLGRALIGVLGWMFVFLHPEGRPIPAWMLVGLRHFIRRTGTTYVEIGDDRRRFFPAVAHTISGMYFHGEDGTFVVDPPFWWFLRYIPGHEDYWKRHVPYRRMLKMAPQGTLELMTDEERAGRWHALTAGLRGLRYPVQFVTQARAEDVGWLAERAAPPMGSPFESLREKVRGWASDRASVLGYRQVYATAAAPDLDLLAEHVADMLAMVRDTGLSARLCGPAEVRDAFSQPYGERRFYPDALHSFGVDDTEQVTLVVRHFPRHCFVGWPALITRYLPVDMGLYAYPDDGTWLTKMKQWFEGMCLTDNPDTAHKDAFLDLERVEGKIKRQVDSVQRTTLLFTMPRSVVPRVKNRLLKVGAEFREATGEHEGGRIATLPVGGIPRVGDTRPLDGESVAAALASGSSGLRMPRGSLIGVSRYSPEVVTLDLRDDSLRASMVVIVGATGAGKTFLMQLLIERTGLPFTLVDMKPHLDERRHGDFYRFTMAAGGNYHVCQPGKPLPTPHPTAQTYNLAMLTQEERGPMLLAIGEQEWARAVDSLEDRIFGTDEANLLGQTETGREFVERIVSQGRSVGFIGIAATQEVTDLLKDDRMAKAVTMSSVQFVMAQEWSNVDLVCTKMKLGGEARVELERFIPNPEEDEDISHDRYALLRVGQRMVSMKIEASPEEYALFTTKPADRRAMRAQVAAD